MSDSSLPQARGELTIDVSQALAALKSLKAEQASLAVSAKALGTSLAGAGSGANALTAYTGETVKLGQAVKNTKATFADFQGSLGTVADGLAKLAIPAVAAGVAAGAMAGKFDGALRNVNSIAGLSDDALQDLGQSFLDLSNDSSKTRESAVSLAEGFYEIQSSGFAGADGMKVLEASTLAASAGMTNTAVAGKAIAASLNSYGLAAEEAGRVSDVLFQTVNLGVVNFEELSSTIGRVLPNANALGVDIENVGAAISALTKAGLSGSQAVTNLNSLFSSIIKPTKEASEAAAEYGFDLSAAALQSKGLTQFLQEMSAATGGNVEAMGKLIGSQEGLNAALSLSKDNAAVFTSDLEQMSNAAGKTKAAYDEMGKSVGASLQELRKSFENAAVVAGSQLTPYVQDAAKAVNELVAAFNKLPAGEQQKYIQIAGAIGTVVVGLFALTKATQGVISTITTARLAMELMGAVAAKTGLSLAGVGAAAQAALGPIGLLTAGLGVALALDQQLDSGVADFVSAYDRRSEAVKRFAEAQAALDADTDLSEKQFQQQKDLTKAYETRAQLLKDISRAETGIEKFGDAFGQRAAYLEIYNAQLKATEQQIIGLTTEVQNEIRVEQARAAMADYRAGERAALEGVAAAHTELAGKIALTTEEQDALNEAIGKNLEGGRDAVTEAVDGQVEGLRRLIDARAEYEQQLADLQTERAGAETDDARAGIDERIAALQEGFAAEEAAQAESYARQQAAAVAHVGEMLLAYVSLQEGAGKISSDQAAALREGITKEFGVIPDIIGNTYDEMVARIDQGGLAESIVADLGLAQDAAVAFKTRFDELLAERTAEITIQLNEGALTPEEYQAKLTALPSEITTQVQAETTAAEQAIARVDLLTSTLDAREAIVTAKAETADAEQGIAAVTAAVDGVPGSKTTTMVAETSDAVSKVGHYVSIIAGLPAVKVTRVVVKAEIADALQRRSPSPMEQVLTAIEKGTKDPKTLKVAAEGLNDIKQIADALDRLKTYETGQLLDTTISGFASDTERVLRELVSLASKFDAEGVAAGGTFAEGAGKMASLISAGADALNKLAAREGTIDREAIGEFKLDIERIVREIVLMSAVFDADGVAAAAEFADNAGRVLGLVAEGVDAVTALTEYVPREVTREQLTSFKNMLNRIIDTLLELANDFDQEGLAAGAAFSDAARRLVGLVADGIKAIDSLVTYQTGRSYDQQLTGLSYDLRRVIFVLNDLARQFETEGLDAASAFAKSAGEVLGLVADGVDAFAALDKSKPLDVRAFDVLADNIELAVRKMVEIAGRIDKDLLPQTVEFAEATSKILEPIAKAVDTFERVNDYTGIVPDTFKLLAQDIVGVVSHMVALTTTLKSDGYPAAVEFSETSESIFGGLQAGLDFLTAIAKYEPGAATDNFGAFRVDFLGALKLAEGMATDASSFLDASATWKDRLGTAADNFRAGIDSLVGLDGLSVNLSASISASAAQAAHPAPPAEGAPDTAAMARRVGVQAMTSGARWGGDGANSAGGSGEVNLNFYGDMQIRNDQDIPRLARQLADHIGFNRNRGA